MKWFFVHKMGSEKKLYCIRKKMVSCNKISTITCFWVLMRVFVFLYPLKLQGQDITFRMNQRSRVFSILLDLKLIQIIKSLENVNRQRFARSGRQNLKHRLYNNLSGTKVSLKLRIGTSLYHLLAFCLFSQQKHYQTFTVTVLMEFSEILTQVFPKSEQREIYWATNGIL